MTTLAQIEAAVDALPPEDKQELLLYLATLLRAQSGRIPPPRSFTRDQLNAWISEDEADLKRLGDQTIP